MNKLPLLLFLFLLPGCKEKKPDKHIDVFPALSFIKGQIKQVDTSLYRIVVVKTENNKSDTSYIPREAFSKLAKDFMEIPDISSDKLKNDYEETQFYDETMQSVILTYLTNEEDNEVRRQDVIIDQANAAGINDVETIIIHTIKNKKNTTVTKNLVWYVNSKFTVITKTSKGNEPEKISKLEVVWNDPAFANAIN